MTTDTTALQERIARALYENAEYYGPEPVQPPWDSRDDEERGEWMEIAAAVLPIIARVRRDAARDALDGLARESMGAFKSPLAPPDPRSWAEMAGAVEWYRDAHYPEETP